MGLKNHEEPIVWQKAIQLAKDIYLVTECFPRKEQYRLVDQLCRAAISIPSNIAEGSSRKSTRDYMRFLAISLGSVAEVETQLVLARELKYIDSEQADTLLRQAMEIGKMLNALRNALQQKLAPASPEFRIPDSALS